MGPHQGTASPLKPQAKRQWQTIPPADSAVKASGSSDSTVASILEAPSLLLAVSAHMDDFKGTAEQELIEWLRNVLDKAFKGGIKVEQEKMFIHTGIRHMILDGELEKGNFKVICDHEDYANAIKPVSTPELVKMKDEELLVALLLACFQTLFGAECWLLQPRMDVSVYISALQRHMHAPRAIDLRRLNRVIRWLQKNPKGLTYRQLKLPICLVVVGDSAFQAPTPAELAAGQNPHVMRCYIIAVSYTHLTLPTNREV